MSSVELELSSLRVVGDAGPGDTRTTASDVTLRWSQAGAAGAVMFPDAPAGLYSRVELGAGGDAETYRFDGQVVVGGETFDFRIEDETPLSISLPIDVEVSGGAPTQIRILFDVGAVLTAVPFDQIPPDSGELRIEAGDPEIAGVRASMANAFRVEP